MAWSDAGDWDDAHRSAGWGPASASPAPREISAEEQAEYDARAAKEAAEKAAAATARANARMAAWKAAIAANPPVQEETDCASQWLSAASSIAEGCLRIFVEKQGRATGLAPEEIITPRGWMVEQLHLEAISVQFLDPASGICDWFYAAKWARAGVFVFGGIVCFRPALQDVVAAGSKKRGRR